MTHTVGEIQPLLARIVQHYPTAREAIHAIGISYETYYRIIKAPAYATMRRGVWEKVRASSVLLDTPIEPKGEAVTWSDAAEYATTPEGRAFITECRGAA